MRSGDSRSLALRRRPAGTGPQTGVRAEIENAVERPSAAGPRSLLYAQARSAAVDASAVEDARTDKQVGAPAGAGSTSLVSKGAVPGILGFAVENGALTQSTSSTTVTLRGNLVGWLDLLKNQEFIASYQDGSRFVRGLRRVSYSLTLNTDTGRRQRGAGAVGTGCAAPRSDPGSAREDEAAARGLLGARRDRRPARSAHGGQPRARSRRWPIRRASTAESRQRFRRVPQVRRVTRESGCLKQSICCRDPTQQLSIADIQRILYQRLEALRLLMIDRIRRLRRCRLRGNLLALQALRQGPPRLFEAMRKRRSSPSSTSTRDRRICPTAPRCGSSREGQWGSRLDLTANAALTLQIRDRCPLPQPTDVGGRRDFQLAGQMDVPLGSLANALGAGHRHRHAGARASPSFRRSSPTRAAVSFAGNTFTVEPGWIHAVQAKVTMPVKGSGVKIPLSLSYSNRTELLKEKDGARPHWRDVRHGRPFLAWCADETPVLSPPWSSRSRAVRAGLRAAAALPVRAGDDRVLSRTATATPVAGPSGSESRRSTAAARNTRWRSSSSTRTGRLFDPQQEAAARS